MRATHNLSPAKLFEMKLLFGPKEKKEVMLICQVLDGRGYDVMCDVVVE